jgi:copper transport protein
MRRYLRSELGLIVVLLLLVLSVRDVMAHAAYERSEPSASAILERAPTQVRIWFSEAVEPRFSEVQVLDTNRRRFDRDDLAIVPGEPRALTVSLGELAPGTYTVIWKALSAVDGHTTRGAFPFTVGLDQIPGAMVVPTGADGAGTAPSPWNVASRWLNLLTAVVLAGAFPFLWLLLGRALRAVARADASHAALTPAWEAARRRGLGLTIGVAGAALIATVLALLVQAAGAADVEPWQVFGAPLTTLLGTRYGLIWAARMLIIVTLGALALGLLRWRVAADDHGWPIASVLGGALLLTTSLNSHAAGAREWVALAVGADWVHLVATALWVGGLVQLVLTLPAALAAVPAPLRGRLLATTIPRFSVWGLLAVGVLAITGLYQTWLQVGSRDALTATPYGQTLLVKLALLIPLLALGALNLFIVGPRVGSALGRGTRAAADRLGGLERGFRRVVGVEVVLGALILVAVGLLTSLPPARDALRAQGSTRTVQAEDVQAIVRVAPGEPGLNTFDITLTQESGTAAEVQRVTLRFTHLQMDMGTTDQRLEPTADGRYQALSGALSMPGNWDVQVIVRRAGLEDVHGRFQLMTADPTLASASSGVSGGEPPTRLAIGALMIVFGVLLLVEAIRPTRRRRRQSATVALGCIAATGGLVLGTLAALSPPTGEAVIPNPVPATAESIARGQDLYQQSCTMCHGLNGRGDGPLAATLNPRPADLRTHVAQHTEGQLWLWLSDGVPGTAMPAFRSSLSDEDRWSLINYLRDRFGATAASASADGRTR